MFLTQTGASRQNEESVAASALRFRSGIGSNIHISAAPRWHVGFVGGDAGGAGMRACVAVNTVTVVKQGSDGFCAGQRQHLPLARGLAHVSC